VARGGGRCVDDDITTKQNSVNGKNELDSKIILPQYTFMEKLSAWIGMERGRLSRLAEHLGVTPSAVYRWHEVPPRHAIKVEKFTGISRYELRPDIYGPKPRN
jgi:hypothetical protein